MQINKYHVIFWVLYAGTIMFLDYIFLQPNFYFVRELIVFMMQVWIIYSFLYFLQRFSIKSLKLFFQSIGILFVSIAVLFFLNYIRSKVAKLYGHQLFTESKWYVYNTLNYFISYSLYSIGLFFIIRAYKIKRILATTENEKLLLANKLQESDLNFLRAKINPHFLQNCLNFIYSDIRKTNPNAANAVLILSNIMRYSVADNYSNAGNALLNDEIIQIENMLQIHQLRFENKLMIKFTYDGNFAGKQIPPMILLTLAENVFKYGDLNNSNYPALLNLSVDEQKEKIIFTTFNKKSYSMHTDSSGMGLKNIEDRLTLTYANNFSLEKTDTADFFEIKLVMPYTSITQKSIIKNIEL